MAFTRTRTTTRTFARLSLIKMQVRRVLARARIKKDHSKRIVLGVDLRLIGRLMLYGVGADQRCFAELFIEIDWERNAIHMAAGREDVHVDDRWPQDTAIEVDEALRLFLEIVDAEGLKILCRTRYAPGVDRDTANQRLGFRPADPVQWAGGTVGSRFVIPELDEVAVGVNVIEDSPST